MSKPTHDLAEVIRELASWAETDALGLVVALMDTRSPKPSCRAMVKRMLVHSRIAPNYTAIAAARKRNNKRIERIAASCIDCDVTNGENVT